MRICYDSYSQFLSKAAILAHELALPLEDTRELLAQLSGYDDVRQVFESDLPIILPSRQEVINRLAQLRRDISLRRAAAIVDVLELPMCDEKDFLPGQTTSGRTFGPQSGHAPER